MTDTLSVIIPSRNEMFLAKTVENILENIEGKTEIIVVYDGAWPDPPVKDHERVKTIYHSESIGQRQAVNEAARLSDAKYIMKCDAHCSFDKGFDVKLMADCEYDWTVVPRMYNLHAFDWECGGCGDRIYQGPTPQKCSKCGSKNNFKRVILWHAKPNPETDHMRFDKELRFKYWREFKERPEAQGDLAPTMSLLGACWLMHRRRYWELGGMDEGHGSWGQMGTEIAAKSWLSGGALMVNKKTWFAHMFRTSGGDFSFPYPNSGTKKARRHSQDLWLNDKWPKAIHRLEWLIEKFKPIPGWHEEEPQAQPLVNKTTKGMVYYTDNRLDENIMAACQQQLERAANGHKIISVSLQPIDFAFNIHLNRERGHLTMFKQILAGLEALDTDIVFLVEHDVLYHASHFDFVPPERNVFYYNTNVWKLRIEDGHAMRTDDMRQTSGLCAYRALLLEHYRKRVRMVEEAGFTRRMGFEPGTHGRAERVDDYKSEIWEAEYPNVDIRHSQNLTANRWRKDQYRNQRYTQGWQESKELPYWGKTASIQWLVNHALQKN